LNPVGAQDGPGHFSVNASYILARWGATGLGTVYSGFACNSSLTGAACHNYLQSELMARSRLGIPVSVISETLVAGAGGATIFPQPVLRGCAFDVALESAIGASIARQARLGGTDRGLSPVLQVDTDARFGRFEESYGEDPFLVAEMGVAVATALQGDASGPTQYLPDFARHITLEAKHYMAYGYGGRDWFAADLSNRTLFDTYGKPWHRFMRRAGGRGAMVAHPGVNGLPLHGSRFLLTDVLRNWFGAGGNGVSEWSLLPQRRGARRAQR
jgi:beta-glucosidase